MAQNITLLGASYSAVPAVTLPKTGGGTARYDDASVTTATASDVASGKIFLASDGTITTGTSSGGGGGSIDLSDIKQDYSLYNIGGLFTAMEDGTWDVIEQSFASGTNPMTVNFGRAIKGLLMYPSNIVCTTDLGGEAIAISLSLWYDADEEGTQAMKWSVVRYKGTNKSSTALATRLSSYTLTNGLLSMVPAYPSNANYHPFRFNIPYKFLYWWKDES